MKWFHVVLLAAVMSAASFPALAQCTGTPLTIAQINALVTANTVCGRPAAGYPGSASDRWQEEHLAGSQLWDYKLGPSDLVDPRTQVGTWSTGAASRTDPDTISHVYGATVGFTWVMFGPTTNVPNSSVYSFCTTGTTKVEHVRAFVVASGSGCSSYPP